MCACQKGGLWSKGFLAETVETENKNRNLFQHHDLFCQFCKDSLGKIDARKRVTGQSMRSSAWKHWLLGNKWILQWKLRLRGYKLIGCCKLLLYANEPCDEHVVYFWWWLKWRAMFITRFWSLQWCNFSWLDFCVFIHEYSIIVRNDIKRKYTSRKSCFV